MASTKGNSSSGRRRRRRLVLFPCPFQGHINPMLQLAALLRSQGFSITIIHTNFNAPDTSNHSDFTFAFIQADYPTSFKPGADALHALNANVEAPLGDLLEKMMSAEEKEEVPLCLIMDGIMFSARSVAEKVGLPRIVLRTSNAAFLNLYFSLPMLWEKGYFPIQDRESDAPLIEVLPLRVRDLPYVEGISSKVYKFFGQMVGCLESARAVILNTFEALESDAISQVQHNLRCPVYPIGPLHRFSPNTRGSLWVEDPTCMEWLDQQTSPKSVLYVSFGSMAYINREQLLEIAWGLATADRPFLWVLRHGSVGGGGDDMAVAELPWEFEEAMRGRGKVVQWAPQQDVLRHTAVGGFWTHCGWNLIMESICEGVPMMCWPYFADQMLNARFISHVWKVGVSLENGLERGEIRKAVKILMVEDEGAEMRKRAMEIKAQAERCITSNGMSQMYLGKLVELISSI